MGTTWSGRCPRRRERAVGLLVLAVLAIGLPSAGSAEEDSTVGAPVVEPALAYSVRIEGIDDGSMRALLERSSQLIALAEKPPPTEAGLVRRIEGDFERFEAVLRAEGYYDAIVDYRIDETAVPASIVVMIDPGPPYRLRAYDVHYVDAAPAESEPGESIARYELPGETLDAPPGLAALGLKLGARARSTDILAAERRVFSRLADQARPLARLIDRDAVVDHRDQSMTVRVDIDPGPFTRFGETTIEGLTSVEDGYIRALIPWHPGDPYDERKVAAFREKLIKAGLFSTVVIDRPQQLPADGLLPMTVQLIEGKQRSIGATAKYYTSEGPATELFWEHRNLFGRNEDLRITTEIGFLRQQVTADFVRPDFRRPDQDFVAGLEATRQTTDAFDELGVASAASLRRPLSATWTGSAGGSLEWSQLKDDKGTRSSTLLGAPASLYRDTTDDRLDPRRGMRVRLDATPYVGWFDQTARFFVSSLGGSGYLPLDQRRRFVLAGRVKVCSILGQSRDDIPPNKRFYAGGGDSVRGYAFQKVGPLDGSNDPLGGRSLLEVSGELRAIVWGNIEVVPFVDGGNVYTPVLPDLSENLRWAAGIGARYLTVIGPVRFDVAFPLNGRTDVDDPFQFYVSLGQAF